METITLTFGDCAENHRGMQTIGEMSASGLDLEDLKKTMAWFVNKGKKCDLVDLKKDLDAEPAYVLIVRDGCSAIVNPDELLVEQIGLVWDTQAFMYGRVVNKKARHNICYSDFEQEPDYEEGKGTVVNFSNLPLLSKIREKLGRITGPKLTKLQCEGNRYYDVKKTYIGFHGDTERRIVVAVRLGADFPIHYQWYKDSKPVGEMFTAVLNHGDMYFMSSKAVGFDWKKKKTFTLRHAAGLVKNVIKPIKSKVEKVVKKKEYDFEIIDE
jgi:hypothetical protein